MANSSSFLGKDRGGREEWNKLLSGLKHFTCARVSPAKSCCCYLLPVHSALSETRWAVSLGATAGASHRLNTSSAIPEKQRSCKPPLQPQNESPREEAPVATVGSLHGYHPHAQREEEGEKESTKNKTPQSQNNSAFGKIKQQFPAMEFTSAASAGATTTAKIEEFTHMLFNSIAEGHKTHLAPTPNVLILRLKFLTEQTTKQSNVNQKIVSADFKLSLYLLFLLFSL